MRVATRLSLVLLILPVLLMAGCDEPGPTAPTSADLSGRWRLLSIQATGAVAVLDQAGRFSIEFSGARLSAQADCNVCNGTYVSGADRFTVSALACTRAACQSPLANPFVEYLASATSAAIFSGKLRVISPPGRLVFVR